MNVDFAVILVLLVATSGVICLLDVVFLAPGRRGGVVGKASDLPEAEPKRPVVKKVERGPDRFHAGQSAITNGSFRRVFQMRLTGEEARHPACVAKLSRLLASGPTR